jgi:hypothetical protein
MVIPSEAPPPSPDLDPHHVVGLLGEVLTLATAHNDPVRVCYRVAGGAAELPGVAAAGVLVRSPAGSLVPVGASGEQSGLLEMLEAAAMSKLALDCATTGRPSAVEQLDSGVGTDWQPLREHALPLGLRAAYVLPLATGASTVGVLHLLGAEPVPPGALSVGRSLASVATLALLGADPDLDAAVVVRRLHLAVEARITVEQAKGVLAARFAISPEVAFGRLVAAATLAERSLGDVATAVVERQTDERLDAALATSAPTDG